MLPVAAPANTHVIFGSLDHITLMKAKDIFGLIVRVFGLAAFVWGFWYLYSALFMWMHGESIGSFVSRDYLAAGAMCVVVGLFLLRKADWVAGFTYPDSKKPKDEDISENDDHVA